MLKNTELKTILINDKELPYYEYTDDKGFKFLSSSFIQVIITQDYIDLFKSVGGVSREVLLTPILKNSADKLSILTKLNKDLEVTTCFLYEKDNEIVKYSKLSDTPFLAYTFKFLKNNEIVLGKLDIKNSLTLLEDVKYRPFLEDVYYPKDTISSGLYFKDTKFNYGDSFRIKGLKQIKDKLAGDILDIITVGGVDSILVKIKDLSAPNLRITEEILEKEDGKPFTVWDWMVVYTKVEFHKDLTDDELLNFWVERKMESFNTGLKSFIDNRKKEGVSYTEDDLKTIIEGYKIEKGYYTKKEEHKKELLKEKENYYLPVFFKEDLNMLLSFEGITVEIVK